MNLPAYTMLHAKNGCHSTKVLAEMERIDKMRDIQVQDTSGIQKQVEASIVDILEQGCGVVIVDPKGSLSGENDDPFGLRHDAMVNAEFQPWQQ